MGFWFNFSNGFDTTLDRHKSEEFGRRKNSVKYQAEIWLRDLCDRTSLDDSDFAFPALR
jgi:hypothetical protein